MLVVEKIFEWIYFGDVEYVIRIVIALLLFGKFSLISTYI